jgi:uncharacterized protein (DUF1800 family)
VLAAHREARGCLSWLATQTAQIKKAIAALHADIGTSRGHIKDVKDKQQALKEVDNSAFELKQGIEVLLASLAQHKADLNCEKKLAVQRQEELQQESHKAAPYLLTSEKVQEDLMVCC